MSNENKIDWNLMLKEIKKVRTDFFTLPDPDLDPRREEVQTQAALEHHGLPPKPDRHAQPRRRAFWDRMFSRHNSKDGVTFVDAKIGFEFEPTPEDPLATTVSPMSSSSIQPNRGGKDPRSTGSVLAEANLNWSGASVTARDGRMFTQVHGSWIVPRVSPPGAVEPSGEDEPADADASFKEYRCSTWIGLDGQRRYDHASLPQIGTSQFIKVTSSGDVTSTTGVWWQWWLRDAPNPLPILLPLPVDPGDEMMASLFVVDSTHVKYLIANRTKGIICTPFTEETPTSYLPSSVRAGAARVSGATAEWITERPMNWVTGEVFDLPDYGTVTFRDCLVVSGQAPGVDEREEQPSGAQLFRMYDLLRNPYRSTVISGARRERDGSFTTQYLGPSLRQLAPASSK
jgi:hypothetical protein